MGDSEAKSNNIKKDEKNEKKAKGLLRKKVYGVSLRSIIWNCAKKVGVVGIVYFVGYMNWSIAWFIGPVVLYALRDQWREEKELKRNIAKATAMSSEKEVILARVDDLPAWVFFPDVERVEWLNRIMRQVWPNVNHYARDLLKKSIEPSIQDALSGYGFKFDRIILGSIPPRIGGVKVYDKNISRNEIIMDLDIFYAGDCDITFTVKGGIKGGIKDFQLHGLLRVVMKPLIPVMPIVGGLQVFFLNNPTIDFNLVGVADILDMPGLSDMLRRTIVEIIASMMVLPNKFPIKLSNIVESDELKTPEPEGVIRIHVVEAKHLMKKDISVLGKGKSDPYAVVNVGAQEFRTQTINNSVDPKWDYWCEFTVLEAHGQKININIWDADDGPKDDESLGRATVEISSVVKQGQADMWLTLEQAKHGMVHLRMTWLRLSSDYSDLKAALNETQQLRLTNLSCALLIVYIDSAKNLPQARSHSKPDPYVMISVGKNTQQTAVQMRKSDPVWEQGFSFLVGNPESDTLHFKVMDHKTGSELGHYNYNISQLSEKTKLEVKKQPFALLRGGGESKLIMSMKLRIFKYEAPKSEVTSTSQEVLNEDGTINGECILQRKDSTMSTKSTGSGSPKRAVAREASQLSQQLISEEQNSTENNIVEEQIDSVSTTGLSSSPSGTLIHRTPSVTSSAGEAGLGRIQLTLRYSVQRQKLVIVVHKVANLPLKDPSNIPDPYVKLYLLPDRVKDSKRKTPVIKDNCNPTYDETFEYLLSQGELNSRQLEVSVVTQKKLFSSGSNIMGQVIIDLNQYDLIQPYSAWFDLQPETPRE